MWRTALEAVARLTRRPALSDWRRSLSTGRPGTLSGVSCSCAAVSQQETVPAEPGTVAHHDWHIFVRLPMPNDSQLQTMSDTEPWWPPYIEKEAGITKVYSAIAATKRNVGDLGPVKVSACIELGDDGIAMHDVYMFPPGVGYRGVDLKKVQDIVAYHLINDAGETPSKQPTGVPPPIDMEETICLFVCCHGARDSRCGVHGIPLAKQLHREVKSLQEAGEIETGDVRIFQVSHVGGHKYAGNVIVHGALSVCDGEWYGGLRASDAKQFLHEILTLSDDSQAGGYHNPVLRKWWRGSIGLTRHEQAAAFATPQVVPGEDDESDTEEDDDLPVVEEPESLKGMIQYMDEDEMAKKIAELEADEVAGRSPSSNFFKSHGSALDLGADITAPGHLVNEELDNELQSFLETLPEDQRTQAIEAWRSIQSMGDDELKQALEDLERDGSDSKDGQ